MSLSNEFFEEVELLAMFNPDNTQEGLKIHHDADPSRISAAKRLFAKDLISLEDGGYLTSHGIGAAQHTRALVNLLRDTD